MLSEELAKKITVSRTFAFKHGDLPYFGDEVVGCFVRVKLPDGYKWSKITAATLGDEIYAAKNSQKNKNFNLTFTVEFIENPVMVSSISGTPAIQEEIERYFTTSAAAYGDEKADKPESYTTEVVNKMAKQLKDRILERVRSTDDITDIIALNTKLYPTYGNAVAQTSLLEKNAFVSSQAEAVAEESSMPGATQNSFSQEGDLTQTVGRRDTVTHFDQMFSPTPGTPGLARMSSTNSESAVFSTEKAVKTNDSFSGFVSNPDRCRQVEHYARMTEQNRRYNEMLRERGQKFENQLKRKGNLVESTGLWMVDDEKRRLKAEEYDAQKEAEREGKEEKEKGGKDNKSKVAASAEEEVISIARSQMSIEVNNVEEAIPDEFEELARRSTSLAAINPATNQVPSNPAAQTASHAQLLRSSSTVTRLHLREATFKAEESRKRLRESSVVSQ